MSDSTPFDQKRRLWLARILAGSTLAAVPIPLLIREAVAAGKSKARRGVVELKGDMQVNGKPVEAGARVKPGDTVTTGAGSSAVFVVGKDAFLLRENSRLEIAGTGLLVKGLRLASGKLLSAFGGGARQIKTATATMGVRGTGIYVEAEPERTYVCTCYGVVDLRAAAMPGARETVKSFHHDAPRYIYADAKSPIQMIERAPMINHADQELIMLEAVVGRVPPFVGSGREYKY